MWRVSDVDLSVPDEGAALEVGQGIKALNYGSRYSRRFSSLAACSWP